MGKHAVKIANLDVKKLIDMLNSALSEEWKKIRIKNK